MFVTIASISNEQTYSFLKVANTALMFPLMFLLMAITANVPFSLRPERVFLRLLVGNGSDCDKHGQPEYSAQGLPGGGEEIADGEGHP
ncbi:hypothetical protein ES703_103122 [subsurface metagenome]